MKRRLVIFPIIASFLFGYGCANKPTPKKNYTFSFEGTKCRIDNYFIYNITLIEGDKNVVFKIDTDQSYILPSDSIKIDGDNVTYNEETHKITISEVTGNIKVTATAREPTFTFEGSNCSINGSSTYTQKLSVGEKKVSFKIDITKQDYILIRSNVLVTGKNWTFDEETCIFTINEVVGDINVNAHANATKSTFIFTGINCTIKDQNDFTKILNIGDKGVEFEIAFDDNSYVLTKDKVKISGKNVNYIEGSHKIIISEVVEDISITATASVPAFNFQGTYCSINGYSTYSEILDVGDESLTFDVTLLAKTTLPKKSVEITGYNTSYDETTHKITISKVTSDVVVKAVAIPSFISFSSNLTHCHFEKDPSTSYPIYSEVDLKLVPDKYYKLPPDVIVEPTNLDYTYDSQHGTLTINSMPAENVKISAEGALGWVHVDDDYQIVLGEKQIDRCQDAHQINEALDYCNQLPLTIVDANAPSRDTEIILDGARSEAKDLLQTITESEGYAIRVKNKKIVIAAKTKLARTCAVDHLLTEYYTKNEGIVVPIDCDIKGVCKKDDIITQINLPGSAVIRDPYIVYENYTYYLYGTNGQHGLGGWPAYKSEELSSTGWTKVTSDISDGYCPGIDEGDILEKRPDRWAPEIHKYTHPFTGETNYYMFTTYRSAGTGLTALVVYRSNSLTKDFKICSHHDRNEYQPGFIFDERLSGLDATLYVDSNKTPWMFYGGQYNKYYTDTRTYVLCRLTVDLEEIAGDYVNIFNAASEKDKYWWSRGAIGDGPFINKLSDGRLLMQFSNFDKNDDYAVGFLVNKEGDKGINDPTKWIPRKRAFYTKDIYDGAPDGGHSMTFNVGEQMYMTMHNPNLNVSAHPVVFPVKEAYGTLVWDLYLYSLKQ